MKMGLAGALFGPGGRKKGWACPHAAPACGRLARGRAIRCKSSSRLCRASGLSTAVPHAAACGAGKGAVWQRA